ncbi:MAG: CRTAC1 family protein [Myxococcota bacterium]|nr:CRTAC1 family protein [Myxococcota bacterium]
MFVIWTLLACGENEEKTTTQDTGTEATCVESAAGELPSNAEWIILDGNSESIFSLSDGVLSGEWEGNYGTYDLNSVALEGGNGFYLSRPGQVVGASVQWANLPAEASPVELVFWPDFGSNGYTWDRENPYTVETRCLSEANDAEWVDYILPEPITIHQPLHVFAGYQRAERPSGSAAESPEIYQEDYQNSGEPYTSGAWFIGVDDELYHHGMTTPWYTWRIRLAVVYDEEIAPQDKHFQADDAMPTTGRVAWADFDNDGDDDIMAGGPTLFRNDDGIFTDITEEAIVTDISSNGGVWGDFNNDGCLDYFGQSTQDLLLQNSCNKNGEGYILSDVTEYSTINDIQIERDCDGDSLEEHSPTEGSAWFDADNDGWLDLYLANYECSSDFDYFKNYDDRLWRNNGDGTFSDWTDEGNIPTSNQAGRGATTIDIDLDGDTDLFVSNYRLDANFFLISNGDGSFTNRASPTGTIGNQVSGAYGHTIGSVFGDINNDGDFDLIQANLAHPFFYWFSDKTAVLMNDGNGNFDDEASQRGIYYRETHSNPTLFDADNDGDLDLFISSIYQSRDSDFYLNDGYGHFTLQNYESGLMVRNGWGTAAADFDNDGDVDIYAREMFENTLQNNSGWLEVRLFGGIMGGPSDGWSEWRGRSNLSAIGAVVRLQTDNGEQLRHVSGGSGTGVQDSNTLHFGLGEESVIDSLIVYFPGGNTVALSDLSINQKVWIHEDGSHTEGFTWPSQMIPPPTAETQETE